jgi:hypothetical protein
VSGRQRSRRGGDRPHQCHQHRRLVRECPPWTGDRLAAGVHADLLWRRCQGMEAVAHRLSLEGRRACRHGHLRSEQVWQMLRRLRGPRGEGSGSWGFEGREPGDSGHASWRRATLGPLLGGPARLRPHLHGQSRLGLQGWTFGERYHMTRSAQPRHDWPESGVGLPGRARCPRRQPEGHCDHGARA